MQLTGKEKRSIKMPVPCIGLALPCLAAQEARFSSLDASVLRPPLSCAPKYLQGIRPGRLCRIDHLPLLHRIASGVNAS